MILMGLGNLFRSKLRTFLTLLGVIVGIGALASMLSFGAGIRKNITDAFTRNDLFTSLTVFPQPLDIQAMASGQMPDPAALAEKKTRPLNDSLIEAIREMPGVVVVTPDRSFPARLRFRGQESEAQVQIIPASLSAYSPFNELQAGVFYANDTASGLVIREDELDDLKIRLENGQALSRADSLAGYTLLPADSIVGSRIELVTMVVDPSSIRLNPFMAGPVSGKDLLKEERTRIPVLGIMKRQEMMGYNRFRGHVMISPGQADRIPRVGFENVWELLGARDDQAAYATLYVRVRDMQSTTPVKDSLEHMGYGVFSMNDQLAEFKQEFLIFQSLLGAIGFIALFVAALGIINTMVMSILERIREIGIMKSIGASDRSILWIFFTEAGVIGFFGGIFGLALGWGVTRVANLIIQAQMVIEEGRSVDLFYFPWWLLAGSLAFSILVSLAAGLFPAIRASRVDPVKALRHD